MFDHFCLILVILGAIGIVGGPCEGMAYVLGTLKIFTTKA
jgi:hypothetical protein